MYFQKELHIRMDCYGLGFNRCLISCFPIVTGNTMNIFIANPINDRFCLRYSKHLSTKIVVFRSIPALCARIRIDSTSRDAHNGAHV